MNTSCGQSDAHTDHIHHAHKHHTQGCGMEMYADKRKGHHEKYCDMRFGECPLGCGKKIRERDKFRHLETECVRRFQANT